MEISWQDFAKVDMRIGTIISAEPFPEARNPAYILRVDFGDEIGMKKSSAQITAFYEPDELIGKQIMAVINFPPKQIGPIRSECLVMGAYNDHKEVVLMHPERPLPNGAKIG